MRNRAALLLIAVLTASSLLMVEAAPASAYTTPAVPEFTAKFADHSYDVPPHDVPPTYGIDQYTGKNITIQEGYHEEGYHVENKSIEITIKRQPSPNLFYNVRYKGHFGDNWTELYSNFSSGSLLPQSSSGDTVVSFPAAYPYGAQVDFQVQALQWEYVDVWVSDHWFPSYASDFGHYEQYFTLGETSSWSNTQTVTIPALVTLLSPQNGNFSISDVPLTFAVNQPVSRIQYSLDGKAKVTVTGNTTLTGLPNGYHNVTVYATDEAGNSETSETRFFNVEAQESSPFVPLAATITVIAVVVGASLLLYLGKRKR